MSNITEAGRVVLSPLSHIELCLEEFNELRLRHGDIIFNRTNSTELVGKTAVWDCPIDAVLASYLVRLRLVPKVNPYFFAALLNTRYFKYLFQVRCKKAIGQSNISPTMLREFRMYLPPAELQQHFAAIVDKHRALRATYSESVRQADHLFDALLSEAFPQP